MDCWELLGFTRNCLHLSDFLCTFSDFLGLSSLAQLGPWAQYSKTHRCSWPKLTKTSKNTVKQWFSLPKLTNTPEQARETVLRLCSALVNQAILSRPHLRTRLIFCWRVLVVLLESRPAAHALKRRLLVWEPISVALLAHDVLGLARPLRSTCLMDMFVGRNQTQFSAALGFLHG